MKPTLVVLAAGIGSRYGGLKQIDPVGPHGEVVIDYAIYDALRAGFGKLVFVIRKSIEKDFKETIGSKFEGKVEVAYAYQELDMLPDGFALPPERQKPWGTAHAVMAAEQVVQEPFGVINADDFYGAGSYRLLHDHLATLQEPSSTNYCLVGFTLRNTLSDHGSVARGICRHDDNALLQSVTEMTKIERDGDGAVNTDENGTRTQLTGNESVSMNMWGFTPSFFEHARHQFAEFLAEHGQTPKAEFLIPGVIDRMIRDHSGTVKVIPSNDTWFGVTYPEDKAYVVDSVRGLIDQGVYSENLWGQS